MASVAILGAPDGQGPQNERATALSPVVPVEQWERFVPVAEPLHHPHLPCAMATLLWSIGFWLASWLPWASAEVGKPVVHPRAESAADSRPDYPRAVLGAALAQFGRRYAPRPSEHVMPQSRSLDQLARGQDIHVVWSTTTEVREKNLRVVRFPIDRGLIGWRVLLIRRSDQDRFAKANSLADLSRFRFVQGHDWPDLAVLQHNGLDVQASSSYEGMFRMVAAGRIDAYPRAVSEVLDEVARIRDPSLMIEPHLVLNYPSALYFFVAPGDAALARDLESGLATIHRNGKLGRLFEAHYGDDLRALDLPRRKRVTLERTGLSADVRVEHADWWYRPGRR